ncbi:MAG: response regulator [Anaerolineae bacterium]|nr:response regulator [Anaerolineae bacterium]
MKTILVIEDTHAMREEILKILEFEGYKAIGAEDGVEGVQLAQKYQPDLILCDVMMPGLDGYETIATIRQDLGMETTPFIFLTARASKADMRHGMELGADDYITKPFTAVQLLSAVRTRLKRQETFLKQNEKRMEELRHSIALALPHELRTPLTQMLGFSELLMDSINDLSPADIRESARAINKSSQRMHHIIENFLTYTELETLYNNPERMKLFRQWRTEGVQNIVSDTALRVAQAADREADLKMALNDCPLHVVPSHLAQVVYELIDNAVKFSAPGTPICLTTTVDRGLFTLTVTDQGRGMSAAQIANIGAYVQFERNHFEQQGIGLGLIIAKRLIELYGGVFEISSIPDKQTTVRITLLAQQETDSPYGSGAASAVA